MTETPGFDIPTAHRYFSAHCFNQAWELIEKTGRTPAGDERRCCGSTGSHLALDAAARLHIDQPVDRLLADRPHLCPAGQAENARRYARRCASKSASSRA